MSRIVTHRFIQATILAVVLLHHNAEVSAATIAATEQLTTTQPAEPIRILTITAKTHISELYVDDNKKLVPNEDRWYLSGDVELSISDRLISILVVDTSFSCAGVLASVTADFLVTDASWKCTAQGSPGWYVLGFNDSSWSAAHVIGKNGAVTTPSQCRNLTNIPTISSNASWIWTASIANAPVYDQLVYCRGYLPVCERDSPCLNGGTCHTNEPMLCTCPPGISGKYCDLSYPYNAAALVGESVTMKCQRSKPNISWWLTRPGFTTSTLIASDCKVTGNFSNLFAVDTTDGACNLVISNARVGHAGTYTCEEKTIDDDRTSAQLTVLNGVQQCYSSVSPVVYGQYVTITCQLPYGGNWAPSIQWTDLYGEPVTNETTDTTSSSVTSSIIIPAYFPTVPAFTSAVFFNASSLPDVTDDIEADNTPTNIYYVATPVLDVVCPDGFTKTSQYHCFQLVFEKLDWHGAQTRCQQLHPGAYLAVISNGPEQSDIYYYLANFPNTTKIWTSGYSSTCPDFAWQPVAGYFLPMTFTNWAAGQPSCTSGTGSCMELMYPDYLWSDASCLNAQPVLCEFELTIR